MTIILAALAIAFIVLKVLNTKAKFDERDAEREAEEKAKEEDQQDEIPE